MATDASFFASRIASLYCREGGGFERERWMRLGREREVREMERRDK
jgi:hypothetical protein